MRSRFLSTRTHGLLDYSVGALLMAAPRLLGLRRGSAEAWAPAAAGAAAGAYGLVTDYELGAVRRLPMRRHLQLDIAGGVLLALSPWLFGFARRVWTPHLAFGLVEIGVAAFTETESSTERYRSELLPGSDGEFRGTALHDMPQEELVGA